MIAQNVKKKKIIKISQNSQVYIHVYPPHPLSRLNLHKFPHSIKIYRGKSTNDENKNKK